MRTGDLGFFRDGELFVTGRVKDVIIIRARNHYPQDIEQSAEEAHPAVLPGAAFAVEDEDGDEQLVVVHQLDRQYRDANFDDIVRAIRRAIVEQHELDPHAIVLIRQTSLPITSSGKVQRNLCREQYLAGDLKVVHSWTNPAPKSSAATKPIPHADMHIHSEGVSWTANGEPAAVGPPSRGGHSQASDSVPLGSRHLRGPSNLELERAAERIETWLLEWIVARLGLDTAEISRDRPFAEFGVDSLTAIELSQELEDEFKVPLPPIVAWNYPTPAALARYLAEQSLNASAEASEPGSNGQSALGAESANPPGNHAATRADDNDLASLLAEIENLSDEEVQRLLAEEQRRELACHPPLPWGEAASYRAVRVCAAAKLLVFETASPPREAASYFNCYALNR